MENNTDNNYSQKSKNSESTQGNNDNYKASSDISPQTSQKNEPLAIAAIVLGIVGLIFFWNWIGLICAILGIIFGISAKNKINRSDGSLSGYSIAKAGFIIGVIALGLFIIAIAAYEAMLSGLLGSF